jgi:hypothetical protein
MLHPSLGDIYYLFLSAERSSFSPPFCTSFPKPSMVLQAVASKLIAMHMKITITWCIVVGTAPHLLDQ